MLLYLCFMYSNTLPWQVLSSNVGVGVLTEGWNLDIVESNGEGSRSFKVDISFASSFSSFPVVQLGLTGFDMDQRESSRISLKAENITESGFQAVLSTWASSRVFAVEFNWLAIGS
jgi:hypothetical protein